MWKFQDTKPNSSDSNDDQRDEANKIVEGGANNDDGVDGDGVDVDAVGNGFGNFNEPPEEKQAEFDKQAEGTDALEGTVSNGGGGFGDFGDFEKQKKGEVEKMRMMNLKILKEQNRRKKK